MSVLIREPLPAELSALVERRRQLDLDRYDEVWDGVLHLNPAPGGPHALLDQQLAELLGPLARRAGLVPSGQFNLGQSSDYRVPDRGLHHHAPTGVWCATAVLVLEIVSPDDETWQKLDFYAAHGVQELVVADPETRSVAWHALAAGRYAPVARSAVLGVAVADVAAQLDWP